MVEMNYVGGLWTFVVISSVTIGASLMLGATSFTYGFDLVVGGLCGFIIGMGKSK